ncbi:MAG TPA: DUF983 domain-containing protein [Acidimicrobiia bacterium]|nr:DUF983 domain-containing protein [Acidimicrobiia bacterium]
MATTDVGRVRMLWRGATKRCARCGHGHLFKRWVTMVPDCQSCGLHFEREQGYWTGAIAVNTIVIGGLFAVILVGALIATAPDIPVVPLLAVVVPLMAFGPLFYYPFSKTVWVAVDMAFLQPLGIKLDGS